MIFTIVIALVVALVVLAIIINAVQQHKEKVETEKRNELAKYKNIIEETENLLLNIVDIPVSQQLNIILHQRILDAVKSMSELVPDSSDLLQRLADTENRIKNINTQKPSTTNQNAEEEFTLPDDERATISLIQGIKKLRSALRAEHTKGKIDSQLYITEDRRLDILQLRINVESLIKRGNLARQSKMLGSARQYYEKAIATMDAQNNKSDYSAKRKKEVAQILQSITEELKTSNTKDRLKKQADEQDDLDILFQPKKKW